MKDISNKNTSFSKQVSEFNASAETYIREQIAYNPEFSYLNTLLNNGTIDVHLDREYASIDLYHDDSLNKGDSLVMSLEYETSPTDPNIVTAYEIKLWQFHEGFEARTVSEGLAETQKYIQRILESDE